ncbi:MAG: peptide ligase PGM1-related protein [Actinomycetota bacterium]|nr:peptide ligase PGM1-related protein [Actinomycetota bacterium]
MSAPEHDPVPPAWESGTMVILPSLSFPVAELIKIKGILHYEERLLCALLLLERPDVRIVYLTSMPVDPAIVSYYLSFLSNPSEARRRLHLESVREPSVRPLTDKLLDRPEILRAVGSVLPDDGSAAMLPFNVSDREWDLAAALGVTLDGPRPELVPWGFKSGARRAARRAGVRVPDGEEDLRSVEAVTEALVRLRQRHPEATSAVVKLNNGFSGQGNALITLGVAPEGALVDRWPTTFCAPEERWSTFAAKVAEEGAIAEQVVPDLVASPSVQLRIGADGALRVVSTHDQILGGPGGQVYLGCRFPADPAYRSAIREAAMAVGQVLADEGVVGPFGIDFLVAAGTDGPAVYLSEINLRMGGTTHPFWMARLASGGHYDRATGELLTAAGPRCYLATDNLTSHALVGRSPAAAMEAVREAGLAFEPSTATGVTLHLLGALCSHGKLGATCIAPTTEAAGALLARLTELTSTGFSPAGSRRA